MRIKALVGMVWIWLGIFSHSHAQLSTLGKEFWVGFMENNKVFPMGNNPGASDFAVLVITADEASTGAIEYLGNSVSFSLAAGQQTTLRISSDDLDLLHRSSGVIERKGIHITSTGKIAVHAFNERVRSADGTVILPIGALGQDYYITSHYETLTVNAGYNGNINNESTLLVIATEDNTKVEITTSVGSLSGDQAGIPSIITLNRGQSYQIKAKADLTGSRVRVVGDNADECKKIAVFGGNKWAPVGNCGEANDHLYQQAYPVNTWGTSFVHTALEGRSSGELVKVLASEDGTEVRVNGTPRGTINRGKWLSLNFAEDESAKIETSKPASVTVFSRSMACNRPNSPEANNGDPFMITYSPVEQFLQNITFTAIDLPSIVTHYVNIVVRKGSENKTILDGQEIGNRFTPLSGDPEFSIARMSIYQGSHRLSNPDGFTAYVYGFGQIESYGYAAGAALNNLNFETASEYAFEVNGENVACLQQEGMWEILSENENFTYFVWDFGDGTSPQVGQSVPHTFANPGIYEILVVASISPNTCEEQEEILFEVRVEDAKAEILGPNSVCPDIEEIMYRLKNKQEMGGAKFEVEGGVILQEYGDSVLVKWGAANPAAKLRLIPFSESGCPGLPIEFPVEINQRIQVNPALGPLEICFDPTISHRYDAPDFSSGRGYEWTIVGGQILTGQGSGSIEVSWDQPGITGEISYRAFSLVDNSCDGFADAIQVQIAEELIAAVADLTEVLCFGQSTGSISLSLAGGVPPYDIEWSHDNRIKSSIVTGLSAGFYSVKITDQKGCERILENLEVAQPDQLELIVVQPEGVSCYGKPDGTLRAVVTGGVPPYTVSNESGTSFDSILSLDQLGQGLYSWTIRDTNGCQIPLEFEITSPAAVEVDVRLEQPACPGGSTGILAAYPSGGLGPYVYVWSDNSGFDQEIDNLPAGAYSLEVTDGNGCVSLGRGVVVEDHPQIRMPTGFNPQEIPGNYSGVSNCVVEIELWIYNRWGQLIYQGSEGWDGQIQGKDAPPGTYSFLMRSSYTLEGIPHQQEKKGVFTLIR
ncbi:PKD domain-containing protein [Algoriphagus sanaruensis]|uniref:PKD domain-containing protein n=1 Tax=Algoriphagus sanaruensis TaxID=1727163 RepID=A0A142ENG1_9BACT|nr:PKD domain-containing protein [Algoriphagus sanaruensis]AMQ56666.1 hypothetical protein AO498_09555 [Algoriphagus sanaruensis]